MYVVRPMPTCSNFIVSALFLHYENKHSLYIYCCNGYSGNLLCTMIVVFNPEIVTRELYFS